METIERGRTNSGLDGLGEAQAPNSPLFGWCTTSIILESTNLLGQVYNIVDVD